MEQVVHVTTAEFLSVLSQQSADIQEPRIDMTYLVALSGVACRELRVISEVEAMAMGRACTAQVLKAEGIKAGQAAVVHLKRLACSWIHHDTMPLAIFPVSKPLLEGRCPYCHPVFIL